MERGILLSQCRYHCTIACVALFALVLLCMLYWVYCVFIVVISRLSVLLLAGSLAEFSCS